MFPPGFCRKQYAKPASQRYESHANTFSSGFAQSWEDVSRETLIALRIETKTSESIFFAFFVLLAVKFIRFPGFNRKERIDRKEEATEHVSATSRDEARCP